MNLLKTVVESLDKVRSEDVIVYDMKGISPLFDYMVVASIASNRQADAATQHIKDDLAKQGFDVKNIEGKNTAWVLVDCYDVLVHVFTHEERQNYSLDKIYMDVPKIDLKDIDKI